MQAEEAGMIFYKRLAESDQDERVKEVFLFLLEQESKHFDVFRDIAFKMKQNDIEHEYSINVEQLIEQSIEKLRESVFDTTSSEKGTINLKKCIDIAIQVEQEAVNVYRGIYTSFSTVFHKVVLEIVSEEEKHLETLINVKKKLSP